MGCSRVITGSEKIGAKSVSQFLAFSIIFLGKMLVNTQYLHTLKLKAQFAQ